MNENLRSDLPRNGTPLRDQRFIGKSLSAEQIADLVEDQGKEGEEDGAIAPGPFTARSTRI